MTGQELLVICKDIVARAGEAEAEISARSRRRGIARFAVGELGQHMDVEEPLAVVRVAHGKRVAEVATSRLDPDGLLRAIGQAAKAARLVPESAAFPGFAPQDPTPAVAPPRFAAATAEASADHRASLLEPTLRKIRETSFVSAGILDTTVTAFAVATTRGCARAHDATTASFKVWALETAGGGGAAGFGSHLHRDVGALAIAEETERALESCARGKNPRSMEAGTYDVVMEPAAVTELLEWLGGIAFMASELEQGTSPLAGRMGARITGPRVTIIEDPTDASELGFGAPFDREGISRRRVALVEEGIARGILYDRMHAARMGGVSTGSALPPESGVGGMSIAASCLQLGGGEAKSVDELISGVDRGLYVCRLHYVNGLLEPRRAVMTGLTRDGCFLIEKGKIVAPVGNMRFTDSFLEGLGRCDGMTAARRAVPTWWSDAGAIVAPAIRMRQFHFNGRSQELPKLGV
jgi:PmbA protein